MTTLESRIKGLMKLGFESEEKAVKTKEMSLRGKRVVSINTEGKYAFFYPPYDDLAAIFPEFKELIRYLKEEGYQTNIDRHLKNHSE